MPAIRFARGHRANRGINGSAPCHAAHVDLFNVAGGNSRRNHTERLKGILPHLRVVFIVDAASSYYVQPFKRRAADRPFAAQTPGSLRERLLEVAMLRKKEFMIS